MRIAARPDRGHVERIVPVALRTALVSPSRMPRLIALDFTAMSIGRSGIDGRNSASGSVPAAVIHTPGAWSSRRSRANSPPL